MQFIRFLCTPHSLFFRVLSGVFCGVVTMSWGHTQTQDPQSSDALSSQTAGSSSQIGHSAPRGVDNLKKLDEIVVVATRTAQPKSKIPVSVSIYSAQDILNANISTPEELLRYEVGVSATRSAGGGGRSLRTSTGVQDYNIRGLEGNRVLLIEDGIRAPDIFSFQGNVAAGRAFYDFDSLKNIELYKSSASALYGGGAIGGVVLYTTKDPSDFLSQTRNPYYFSYKQSFDSTDLFWGETATFAARTGPIEYLLLYTRRDGQEQSISASTAKYGPAGANPLSYSQNNLLGKIVYHLNEKNQFRLTGEYFNYHGNSDLISATYPIPAMRNLAVASGMETRDTANRSRASLDYQFTGQPDLDLFKNIQASLYFQQTESQQDSIQEQDFLPNRVGPFRGPDTIYRNEFYRTYIFGGNFQATQLARAFAFNHEWTYGGEVSYFMQRRNLNGYTVEKATGATIPRDRTQSYPRQEIPPSNTLRLGVFLQDQIQPEGASWLMLTPAVRFDYYSLAARNSEDYLRASNGISAVSYQKFSVTPSLSTLIQATRELTFYANFSEGFRNPNTEDLNATFTNPIYGYKVIPNPSLKPEQSYDFEVGTRGNYRLFKFSFSGFYHYYNNFIEDQVLVKETSRGQVYQSRNITNAEIYGVEGKVELPLGNYVSYLEGWKILSICAYTVGNNLDARQPLLTIDPFKIVNTLRYEAPNQKWNVDLVGTWVSTQTRTPAGQISFVSPSYYTIDLVGRCRFNQNALLTVGIYNLTNQTYWLYQNMARPEIASTFDSGGVARYSEPGINVRVSFSVTF